MNLPFFIAKRYLLSKRKKNFINIISILSIVGVAFTTAAIIIVLSVFNGLEDLLRSLNNSFDPQLKIESAEGKSFEISPALIRSIEDTEGVAVVTEVIEDYAYVSYRNANQVIVLKGVSDNFVQHQRIPPSNIVEGELVLEKNGIRYAVLGRGVSDVLSVAVAEPMYPLQVYYVKNVRPGTDPSSMYSKMNIVPGGVFSIVQQFDENYVLVPLSFAQELLNYGNKRTSLEIKIKDQINQQTVQQKLKALLGERFKVLNLQEQHQDLYQLLKMEKLFTFLAFIVLLGIGSINIFFTLMMLALDKKKDIAILSSMGAGKNMIKRIFLVEGALIASIGAVIGLFLGGAFCFLQSEYGLISMGMETAVMQGYPIKAAWEDFLLTLLVVSVVTFLISIRPSILAARLVPIQHL